MQARLRIAVQKSGRLLEGSLKMLKECGIKINNGKDQLKVQARKFPIEILYLRNSDIPQYVQDGVADVGIIGENTAIEKEKKIEKVIPLGFSKCRLSIAVPKNIDYPSIDFLKGKKIATSYPNTLRNFLQQHQIQADIHEQQEILDRLLFRNSSVLSARNNKYLLMNAPDDKVQKIINILPGMKSPTVMPLSSKGWSSIHTVIAEDRFWDIIDELRVHGAEGILIVPIEKMIV